MIVEHLLMNGLFYAIVVTVYLLVMMVTTSPRIWGYHDYSQTIRDKVPPQTKSEKKLAMLLTLPWFIFTLGFPIYSTLVLKARISGDISVGVAFLNLFVLFLFATVSDLLILDWLIISKVTPAFVIIPGTLKEDYKDFSLHFKGHAKALIVIVPILLALAAMISYL
jgi:hypothetical protein